MKKVIIERMPAGSYQVNMYLLACPETHQAVLIDPSGNVKEIMSLIRQKEYQVQYILNTHGHADHIIANEHLKRTLKVPVCMHEDDIRFFADAENRSAIEKELGLSVPQTADIRLKDGDIIETGSLRIEVIHTPGHTPGSVCFLVDGNLFTGDTLFVGDVGRTDLTGGSLEILLESLEKRIITLPDETIVWPGHDYGETPTSTIGQEKEENPYITDFIIDDDV